jgi:hypothetical protein
MKSWRPIFWLVVVGLAASSVASAQTRSITSAGNATSTGNTKITIEDFGKPERRDLDPKATAPAAFYEFEVPIQAGWNCIQITNAIFSTLEANLPSPPWNLQISETNPCIIYISRDPHGIDEWDLVIEVTAPGVTIRWDEGVIPVEPQTWSQIKRKSWIRLD